MAKNKADLQTKAVKAGEAISGYLKFIAFVSPDTALKISQKIISMIKTEVDVNSEEAFGYSSESNEGGNQ